MTGRELKEICEGYEDFEFEFAFTDGYNVFPNIRVFSQLEVEDIGYSSKVIVLSGVEK